MDICISLKLDGKRCTRNVKMYDRCMCHAKIYMKENNLQPPIPEKVIEGYMKCNNKHISIKSIYNRNKVPIELFMKSDADSLISVNLSKHPPWWSFKVEEGVLKAIFDTNYLFLRSQDLKETYQPNGAIYISRPEKLYQNKLFYSEKTIPYVMPPERSIDIDDEFDFIMAECLMCKRFIE